MVIGTDLFCFIERGLWISERALITLGAGRPIDPNDLVCGSLALVHLAIASEHASAAAEVAAELRALAMLPGARLDHRERARASKLASLISVITCQVGRSYPRKHCLHALPCPPHLYGTH